MDRPGKMWKPLSLFLVKPLLCYLNHQHTKKSQHLDTYAFQSIVCSGLLV